MDQVKMTMVDPRQPSTIPETPKKTNPELKLDRANKRHTPQTGMNKLSDTRRH